MLDHMVYGTGVLSRPYQMDTPGGLPERARMNTLDFYYD